MVIQMEYKLQYGCDVLTLPRRVIENLSDVPSDYIKVLLALAGTPGHGLRIRNSIFPLLPSIAGVLRNGRVALWIIG